MNVTQEMVEALETLRRGTTHEYRFEVMANAINTLMDAGVFAEIDREVRLDEAENWIAQQRAAQKAADREAEWDYISRGGM